MGHRNFCGPKLLFVGVRRPAWAPKISEAIQVGKIFEKLQVDVLGNLREDFTWKDLTYFCTFLRWKISLWKHFEKYRSNLPVFISLILSDLTPY